MFLLKSLAFIQLHQSHSVHHSYHLSQLQCLQRSHRSIHTLMFINIPHSFLTLPSHSLDIQHFLNPFTITSGGNNAHDLEPLAQQFYTGHFCCPSGIRMWSPAESCSGYSYLKQSLIFFSLECLALRLPLQVRSQGQYSLQESQI
jgi:hypothetical protein